MTYLLDTQACIALINGTPKDVRRRFQRGIAKQATILVSSAVALDWRSPENRLWRAMC